jgi:hypothetical protein
MLQPTRLNGLSLVFLLRANDFSDNIEVEENLAELTLK